jgi:ketosteroid isomerase-like protein
MLFSVKVQVPEGGAKMSSDQIEIQELVHRYCDALCQRDRDAWVATFAEDGMWNSGRGEVVGRDALSDAFLLVMELFEHVLQLTHNGEVKMDGDTAHGRWYVTVRPYCQGKTHLLHRALR